MKIRSKRRVAPAFSRPPQFLAQSALIFSPRLVTRERRSISPRRRQRRGTLGDAALFIPSDLAVAEHTDGTAERRTVARAHRKVSLAFASTPLAPSRTPTRALLARTAHDRRDVRQRVHGPGGCHSRRRGHVPSPGFRPAQARRRPQARCDHPPRPRFSPIPSVPSRAPRASRAPRPSPSLPRKALSGRPPDRRLTNFHPPNPAPAPSPQPRAPRPSASTRSPPSPPPPTPPRASTGIRWVSA